MVQLPSSMFRRAIVLAVGAATAVAVAAIALPHQGQVDSNHLVDETVASHERPPDGIPPQRDPSVQIPDLDDRVTTGPDSTGSSASQPPAPAPSATPPGIRTATATHTVTPTTRAPHTVGTAPVGSLPGSSALGGSSAGSPAPGTTPTIPKATAPATPPGQQSSTKTPVPEQTSASPAPSVTSSINQPSDTPPADSAAPSRPTSEAQPPPVGGPAPDVTAEIVTSSALGVVNDLRKKAGVDVLAQDSCADSAAAAQAKKQAEAARQEAFHSGNLTACVSGSGSAGENVLYASSSISVQTAINAWMGSGSHAANILSPSYRHMGVARVQGADGHWYWAQYFYR